MPEGYFTLAQYHNSFQICQLHTWEKSCIRKKFRSHLLQKLVNLFCLNKNELPTAQRNVSDLSRANPTELNGTCVCTQDCTLQVCGNSFIKKHGFQLLLATVTFQTIIICQAVNLTKISLLYRYFKFNSSSKNFNHFITCLTTQTIKCSILRSSLLLHWLWNMTLMTNAIKTIILLSQQLRTWVMNARVLLACKWQQNSACPFVYSLMTFLRTT